MEVLQHVWKSFVIPLMRVEGWWCSLLWNLDLLVTSLQTIKCSRGEVPKLWDRVRESHAVSIEFSWDTCLEALSCFVRSLPRWGVQAEKKLRHMEWPWAALLPTAPAEVHPTASTHTRMWRGLQVIPTYPVTPSAWVTLVKAPEQVKQRRDVHTVSLCEH